MTSAHRVLRHQVANRSLTKPSLRGRVDTSSRTNRAADCDESRDLLVLSSVIGRHRWISTIASSTWRDRSTPTPRVTQFTIARARSQGSSCAAASAHQVDDQNDEGHDQQ